MQPIIVTSVDYRRVENMSHVFVPSIVLDNWTFWYFNTIILDIKQSFRLLMEVMAPIVKKKKKKPNVSNRLFPLYGSK